MVAQRVGGGLRFGKNAGVSQLCTHGFIVFFRCVAVTDQVADVTVSRNIYQNGGRQINFSLTLVELLFHALYQFLSSVISSVTFK